MRDDEISRQALAYKLYIELMFPSRAKDMFVTQLSVI